jgi:high-affinity K+ transport system ATPase subunit B
MYKDGNPTSSAAIPLPSSEILLQKLNYMISLLEDQQDEKTSNVTEEVILYSFLGIFIIFIADTFVRAGKYVR